MGLGFRGFGFRFKGLGLRASGLRVKGLGFRNPAWRVSRPDFFASVGNLTGALFLEGLRLSGVTLNPKP